MSRAVKNKIVRAFDAAYTSFPPDRALHLAQQVFSSICDGRDDSHTLTLNDICRELGELVTLTTITFEELTDEIESSVIEGRLSGTLLDAVVEQGSIQRNRQVADFRLAHELQVEEARVRAEEKAAKFAAEKLKVARKASAKRVLCPQCNAEPGLCDCQAQQALAIKRQLAKDKKKDAALQQKVQKPVTEASDAEEEDEEDEEEEEDMFTEHGSPITTVKVRKLDLDDPGVVLDPTVWPRLATRYTTSELQSAIAIAYRDVFETTRHDANFISSVWLQFAATLRTAPNAEAVAEAVKGIRLCRARFEFMLGKKHGALMASTVEAELLDQSLPADLRKARKAGRTAQKEAEKNRVPTSVQPTPKPAAKK